MVGPDATSEPDAERRLPEGRGQTRCVLDLDSGNDVAAVSANVTLPVVFDGGAGNDGLFGGGGIDIFGGGSGDDNVISRDGRAEQVDCGAGNDTAISDDGDVRSSCEEIEGDADGDGVRRPADCNDTNPGIRPGLPTRPTTASTRTAPAPTRRTSTSTATARPARRTATTRNPAIRPGAREVAGNARRRELRHADRALPGDRRPREQPLARGRPRTVNVSSAPRTSPRARGS